MFSAVPEAGPPTSGQKSRGELRLTISCPRLDGDDVGSGCEQVCVVNLPVACTPNQTTVQALIQLQACRAAIDRQQRDNSGGRPRGAYACASLANPFAAHLIHGRICNAGPRGGPRYRRELQRRPTSCGRGQIRLYELGENRCPPARGPAWGKQAPRTSYPAASWPRDTRTCRSLEPLSEIDPAVTYRASSRVPHANAKTLQFPRGICSEASAGNTSGGPAPFLVLRLVSRRPHPW